jgi:hypothetical protein
MFFLVFSSFTCHTISLLKGLYRHEEFLERLWQIALRSYMYAVINRTSSRETVFYWFQISRVVKNRFSAGYDEYFVLQLLVKSSCGPRSSNIAAHTPNIAMGYQFA